MVSPGVATTRREVSGERRACGIERLKGRRRGHGLRGSRAWLQLPAQGGAAQRRLHDGVVPTALPPPPPREAYPLAPNRRAGLSDEKQRPSPAAPVPTRPAVYRRDPHVGARTPQHRCPSSCCLALARGFRAADSVTKECAPATRGRAAPRLAEPAGRPGSTAGVPDGPPLAARVGRVSARSVRGPRPPPWSGGVRGNQRGIRRGMRAMIPLREDDAGGSRRGSEPRPGYPDLRACAELQAPPEP
jgi:hypothetical protein